MKTRDLTRILGHIRRLDLPTYARSALEPTVHDLHVEVLDLATYLCGKIIAPPTSALTTRAGSKS